MIYMYIHLQSDLKILHEAIKCRSYKNIPTVEEDVEISELVHILL